jgi:hypothetical protein
MPNAECLMPLFAVPPPSSLLPFPVLNPAFPLATFLWLCPKKP